MPRIRPPRTEQRIFAFFGKSGVLAFDWEGKQLWRKSVGTGSAIMGWGTGTSLLLYKDLVIVNANAESESLVALDKQTGREVWKAEAKGYAGSWSTPVLVDRPDGKQDLVVKMPNEVWGLNPANGGVRWYCTGIRGVATTSLVAKDGIVYVLGGGLFGSGSAAIRAGGRDDVSKSHVVWQKTAGSDVPSPVIADSHIFWVDDRGQAFCLKADKGEQVYRERLSGAGGMYASGSPPTENSTWSRDVRAPLSSTPNPSSKCWPRITLARTPPISTPAPRSATATYCSVRIGRYTASPPNDWDWCHLRLLPGREELPGAQRCEWKTPCHLANWQRR